MAGLKAGYGLQGPFPDRAGEQIHPPPAPRNTHMNSSPDSVSPTPYSFLSVGCSLLIGRARPSPSPRVEKEGQEPKPESQREPHLCKGKGQRWMVVQTSDKDTQTAGTHPLTYHESERHRDSSHTMM